MTRGLEGLEGLEGTVCSELQDKACSVTEHLSYHVSLKGWRTCWKLVHYNVPEGWQL